MNYVLAALTLASGTGVLCSLIICVACLPFRGRQDARIVAQGAAAGFGVGFIAGLMLFAFIAAIRWAACFAFGI